MDGIPLQRTGSQSSLSSIRSAESLASVASTSSNKNVNKTVMEGVKDIVLWIEHVEEDQQVIIVKETAYQQMPQTAEKDGQERHNIAQAQIMTNIVLQNERASLKRTRYQKNDDNLEDRRSKILCWKKRKKKKHK